MQVPNTNVWHKNKVILYHLSRRTGFTNYLDFFFFSFGSCWINISQENYSFYVILNVPDYSPTYCERALGKSEQIQIQLETLSMNKNKQGIN